MHRTKLGAVLIALGALTASSCETEFVTPLVAARVTVAPHEADLSQGADLQLTATVLDEASQAISQAQVQWSADNRSVVSVDPDGRARAVAPGATLVWATFEDVAGSAAITVLPSAECAPSAAKPKDRPKGKKKSHDGDDDDDDEDEDEDDDDDDEDEGDEGEGEDEGDQDDDDGDGGDPEVEEDEDADDDEDDPRCIAPPEGSNE